MSSPRPNKDNVVTLEMITNRVQKLEMEVERLQRLVERNQDVSPSENPVPPPPAPQPQPQQNLDVLHSDLPGASSISVTDEIAHKMADNVGAHALSLQRMLGLISSTPLPPAPEQSMGSLESYIRGFFHTINTGNLNDLLALPSIGETRANKILKVRAEGLETPFKSHEDFTKIDLSKPQIKTMMKQVVAHFLEKQWN